MHRIPVHLIILLSVLPLVQAAALEASVSGGPQAAQSAVSSINSKMDTSVAALQAEITGILSCNKIRKFYAPGDPKKDGNGCVGIQDYDLTMASGSDITLANGQMNGTQSASNWAGVFSGSNYGIYGSGKIQGVLGQTSAANGYGLVGQATGAAGVGVLASGVGYGLYATSSNGMGVYGASTTNSGVRGDSTNSAGVYGTSVNGVGVYGVNANNPAVKGDSTNSLGIEGTSINSVGVYGSSTNNWAAEFLGIGTTGYGVLAQLNGGAPSNKWAAEFYGGNGVWIGNTSSNAQFCLNGSCITSLSSLTGHQWGGMFQYVTGSSNGCGANNPFTGGCSCPAGFTQTQLYQVQTGSFLIHLYMCAT